MEWISKKTFNYYDGTTNGIFSIFIDTGFSNENNFNDYKTTRLVFSFNDNVSKNKIRFDCEYIDIFMIRGKLDKLIKNKEISNISYTKYYNKYKKDIIFEKHIKNNIKYIKISISDSKLTINLFLLMDLTTFSSLMEYINNVLNNFSLIDIYMQSLVIQNRYITDITILNDNILKLSNEIKKFNIRSDSNFDNSNNVIESDIQSKFRTTIESTNMFSDIKLNLKTDNISSIDTTIKDSNNIFLSRFLENDYSKYLDYINTIIYTTEESNETVFLPIYNMFNKIGIKYSLDSLTYKHEFILQYFSKQYVKQYIELNGKIDISNDIICVSDDILTYCNIDIIVELSAFYFINRYIIYERFSQLNTELCMDIVLSSIISEILFKPFLSLIITDNLNLIIDKVKDYLKSDLLNYVINRYKELTNGSNINIDNRIIIENIEKFYNNYEDTLIYIGDYGISELDVDIDNLTSSHDIKECLFHKTKEIVNSNINTTNIKSVDNGLTLFLKLCDRLDLIDKQVVDEIAISISEFNKLTDYFERCVYNIPDSVFRLKNIISLNIDNLDEDVIIDMFNINKKAQSIELNNLFSEED